MEKLNLALVDDHTLFRQGLINLIKDFDFIGTIKEAESGDELFKLLKSGYRPDLIILDLELPEMDGIEISRLLIEKYPEIKILILTIYNNDELIVRLLKIGINGYLSKNSDANEIENALRTLSEHDVYYDMRIMVLIKNMLADDSNSLDETGAKFTPREVEVLKLICKELNNRQIADKLDLSLRTVEKMKSKLLTKVGARNSVGLIKYAYVNNLVEI